MNLRMIKKSFFSSIFFAVLANSAFAEPVRTVQSAAMNESGRFYLGVFGGDGSSSQFHASQFGSAFFLEDENGPLAVNAFGHTKSQSGWLAGAQVGYQARDILFNPSSDWRVKPAIELEGYYLGNRSFTGDLINNTTRIPEHDFVVRYPMKRSVFLTNAVFSLNNPCYLFHPYIGVGFGGAIVEISGANSTQVEPFEVGINHYNSNTSDTSPTFAGQVKAGLSYDINEYVSLFAEYRWLYLSSTHFAFGSTDYPTHVPTTNWQVKIDSQRYNMGVAGIRFNL